MEVIITDFAKFQLKGIFEYYSTEVSETTASKLIDKIIAAIQDLERLTSIGAKEPLLSELKSNHRYLVAGNYKIIFLRENEITYITDIFDCRQNPTKIIKRNKRK